MLALSRERVEHGLQHTGGAVEWWTIRYTVTLRLGRFFIFNVLYRLLDWKRKIQGQPIYQGPGEWEITVLVVLQNEDDAILWHKTAAGWHLPGGIVPSMNTPWETAVALTHHQTGLNLHLTDLRGVYVIEGSHQMTLVFTAVTEHIHPLPPTFHWLSTTDIPTNQQRLHYQFALEAIAPDTVTTFKLITA
jgi:hypothetical protein